MQAFGAFELAVLHRLGQKLMCVEVCHLHARKRNTSVSLFS